MTDLVSDAYPTACGSCLHRRTPYTCDAFPREIPSAIGTLGKPHSRPVPGQKNNVVYEYDGKNGQAQAEWREFAERSSGNRTIRSSK